MEQGLVTPDFAALFEPAPPLPALMHSTVIGLTAWGSGCTTRHLRDAHQCKLVRLGT
jgi:hypothetical protein